MYWGLWFQLFPRPSSILDLLSGPWFNFTSHLSRPDREIETQLEWLQSMGGSFSALKRSPRVGHRWLIRRHQGPMLLLSFWLIISSTGFYPHGHKMATGVPAILPTFQTKRVLIPTDLASSPKGFLGSFTMMSTVLSSITLNYKESWEPLLCSGTPSP